MSPAPVPVRVVDFAAAHGIPIVAILAEFDERARGPLILAPPWVDTRNPPSPLPDTVTFWDARDESAPAPSETVPPFGEWATVFLEKSSARTDWWQRLATPGAVVTPRGLLGGLRMVRGGFWGNAYVLGPGVGESRPFTVALDDIFLSPEDAAELLAKLGPPPEADGGSGRRQNGSRREHGMTAENEDLLRKVAGVDPDGVAVPDLDAPPILASDPDAWHAHGGRGRPGTPNASFLADHLLGDERKHRRFLADKPIGKRLTPDLLDRLYRTCFDVERPK